MMRVMMDPRIVFPAIWALWALSWIIAAGWSSAAVKRPARGPVLVYRALMVLGFVLILPTGFRGLHIPALWHVGRDGALVLALLMLPGFAFAWWARIHLGRLWSGSVTLKGDHRVIDTGPYRLVRHPIYTGLLEASLVSAIAAGTVLSALGFALMTAGIWRKARIEEGLLVRELGPAEYAAYRRRVPMFVPFAWPEP